MSDLESRSSTNDIVKVMQNQIQKVRDEFMGALKDITNKPANSQSTKNQKHKSTSSTLRLVPIVRTPTLLENHQFPHTSQQTKDYNSTKNANRSQFDLNKIHQVKNQNIDLLIYSYFLIFHHLFVFFLFYAFLL